MCVTSNFCYLLRFVIISCVHGAFSLSINVHAQNIEIQNFLLRKSLECFDTGIMKRSVKCQYWAKETFV